MRGRWNHGPFEMTILILICRPRFPPGDVQAWRLASHPGPVDGVGNQAQDIRDALAATTATCPAQFRRCLTWTASREGASREPERVTACLSHGPRPRPETGSSRPGRS